MCLKKVKNHRAQLRRVTVSSQAPDSSRGWADPGSADIVRRDLTDEALLAGLVAELLPEVLAVLSSSLFPRLGLLMKPQKISFGWGTFTLRG